MTMGVVFITLLLLLLLFFMAQFHHYHCTSRQAKYAPHTGSQSTWLHSHSSSPTNKNNNNNTTRTLWDQLTCMRVCVCVCCVVGKIFSLTHRIYKHSQNHQKETERARVHPQSYHCSTLNGYDVDVVVFITISNTPFGWLALFFGWTNTVIETQLTHLYTYTRTPFIILSFCCC